MLRADRLCVWIMILGLILLVPSYNYVKFNDELCSMLFLGVASLDCIVNRNWRRYRLLFAIIGVMTFYAIYTLAFKNYNTPRYVLVDWIIEIKPYIPFAVIFAIRSSMTSAEKQVIKAICIVDSVVVALLLACGETIVAAAVGHVTYIGLTLFTCSMLYMYCSVKDDGSISRRDMAVALVMLTIGLGSTRSKYYAIYVLSLFFLLAYRPGMLRSMSLGKSMAVTAVVIAVIAVSWSKFDYYYISGGTGKFDRSVAESFARPVLYATSALIFAGQFPFGSGLASFASFASMQNYSGLYAEYGIDHVHGLSEDTGFFICDAFFPSLAQFGVAGLVLFMAFWVYAYSFLRRMIRVDGVMSRYEVAIGILLILHIMIECTSGNTFTQPSGMIVMCLLGFICGKGAGLKVPEKECIMPQNLELKKI